MSLFKCPECGKMISDKANACPNCGCPIEKMDILSTNLICPECGQLIYNDASECPNCGCPKDRIVALASNENNLCNADDEDACWFCGKYHSTKVYEYSVIDVDTKMGKGNMVRSTRKVEMKANIPCCEQCYDHFKKLDKFKLCGGWIGVFIIIVPMIWLCTKGIEYLIPTLSLGIVIAIPLCALIGGAIGEGIWNRKYRDYSNSLRHNLQDHDINRQLQEYVDKHPHVVKWPWQD